MASKEEKNKGADKTGEVVGEGATPNQVSPGKLTEDQKSALEGGTVVVDNETMKDESGNELRVSVVDLSSGAGQSRKVRLKSRITGLDTHTASNGVTYSREQVIDKEEYDMYLSDATDRNEKAVFRAEEVK